MSLPTSAFEWIGKPWTEIGPHFDHLLATELTADNVDGWLREWSALYELVSEVFQRLYVAITVNTTDQTAEQQYNAFLDEIYPASQAVDQKLKEKLIASGLEPQGFETPLRNLRAQAKLFREENLPLLAEELKLGAEYDKVIGAQVVTWDGEERTVMQMRPVLNAPDRARREQAWRLTISRQLADRETINALWRKGLAVRRKLAANAGLPSYRDYRWVQMLRFDYTPDDCGTFHAAIEEVVVPAARRAYERRRQRLDLPALRPWDLDVDPLGLPPLRPYRNLAHLQDGVQAIFNRVDPQLGEYFATMRREGLLDLDNRKGKAPGGYCTEFAYAKRPFIFTNAVGLHDDVQTLLHEGGHAFHVFETAHLPYVQQKEVGLEFAEVASMSMELLSAPYLSEKAGGFYSPADAARAFSEHLEGCLLFWPYMAVVDAFQHWVYEHPDQADDPAQCDAQWSRLWDRFMPGVDWSGLENEKATGWHRKPHIHESPFYYVEYGLAQLGAMQVWRNALNDQAGAVRAYRSALALGGSRPLPELYQAAGARLAFDAPTLRSIVELVEHKLEELEAQYA
jgi:oligoendopeptidase F